MAKKFLEVLASVREKLNSLEKIDGDVTLDDVKQEYRKLFDTDKDHYWQGKEQLESDILIEKCGIKGLKEFYGDLGCCWLDFFGSDSFSDSKKKETIILCYPLF